MGLRNWRSCPTPPTPNADDPAPARGPPSRSRSSSGPPPRGPAPRDPSRRPTESLPPRQAPLADNSDKRGKARPATQMDRSILCLFVCLYLGDTVASSAFRFCGVDGHSIAKTKKTNKLERSHAGSEAT